MIVSWDRLASQAKVSKTEIERLVELGLLQTQKDGGFTDADIGRVHIIDELTSRGVSVEDLAGAAEDGVVSFSWFDGVLPPPPELRDETYGELFDRAGLAIEPAVSLFEVWGVAMPSLAARVREDDVRLVEYLSEFMSYVEDEGDVLVEATRYFGDNIRRMAESQIAFFRRRILESRLDAGMNFRAAIESANPLVDEVFRPGARELMLWLHRRHMDAMSMQMLVETLEVALEESGVPVPTSENLPSITFVDLSGFTSRTDLGGDVIAADLAVRFSDIVRTQVKPSEESVVKFLGDGVMLHFSDAESAVRCAFRIVCQVHEQGLPPARAGLDVGDLVFRDGDYFGRTVNSASRIADCARPGEVLISEKAATQISERSTVALRPIGPVELKGLSEPVALHAVIAVGDD